MKKIVLMLALCVSGLYSMAQTSTYERKYDLLVSQLGPAGIGVETVLNNWEKEDSTDAKMLLARFEYYFVKSQSSTVITRPERKYLGMEPILTLKDSLGVDVFYYEEKLYDDELYGMAIKAIDRAIAAWPERLDMRFIKTNAYLAYEKGSPDMALANLIRLVDENYSQRRQWTYPDMEVDGGFFADAIQDYCFTFHNVGGAASMEAFRKLSEKMLEYEPKNVVFMGNMGSYCLLAKKDYKAALKWYNKVLKIKPDDYTAIKNSVLVTRRQQNIKAEKKYLKMLAEHGTESDRLSAKARLERLK